MAEPSSAEASGDPAGSPPSTFFLLLWADGGGALAFSYVSHQDCWDGDDDKTGTRREKVCLVTSGGDTRTRSQTAHKT